ncbi:MAG: energy-coupling factor transporter transmembrane protein EcfT [Desulfovibrionales bacterium]|nr:energy-coupling factor transporter transmembrane protein EcfT [Desulfovibrionales bacterium]
MVNPFAHRPGRTPAHRLDVRCKLPLICALGMAIFNTGLWGNAIWLVILIFTLKKSGTSPLAALGYLKFFILFLGIIALARALGTPEGHVMVRVWKISLTDQGIAGGILAALRFFLVMILGMIFSTTTRPVQVKAAAQWFLAPIPFVPAKRVGLMISLALGFLPKILTQLTETQNALAARCGHLEKNPIKRSLNLILPLMKKTFSSADQMILAMESRCYREDRTDPAFSSSGQEAWITGLFLALMLGLFFLP